MVLAGVHGLWGAQDGAAAQKVVFEVAVDCEVLVLDDVEAGQQAVFHAAVRVAVRADVRVRSGDYPARPDG